MLRKTTNPFISGLEVRVKFRMKPPEPGESLPHPFFVEQDKSTRFYHKAVSDIIPDLSAAGCKLLFWIASHLTWGSDQIELETAKYLKWSKKTSRQTYYNARKELIDQQIIAHDSGNAYWINPAIFFCGNRVKYAVEHKVVKVMGNKKQEPITEEQNSILK